MNISNVSGTIKDKTTYLVNMLLRFHMNISNVSDTTNDKTTSGKYIVMVSYEQFVHMKS